MNNFNLIEGKIQGHPMVSFYKLKIILENNRADTVVTDIEHSQCGVANLPALVQSRQGIMGNVQSQQSIEVVVTS